MRKNILFIMFDQLRFDYLSCSGHKTLRTPHIDAIASQGVRFSNCYVQSPVCGASRMSTYTGRYVHSHGASWNNVPLKVGELTLGDHLRAAGMDCWLIGKTHMQVDTVGMQRLGLSGDSLIGARVGEAGFDVWLRDDGLWAQGSDGYYDRKRSPYNAYLKALGYDSPNPWADHANAGFIPKNSTANSQGASGETASGWFMKYADLPANIAEPDSETPWLTTQAMEFIAAKTNQQCLRAQKNDARPWLCHLSYIKPHWPYIVPTPYHKLYGLEDIQPICRHPYELKNPHPVYKAFAEGAIAKAFARDEVRRKVIPAYMGLIAQIDDQIGRLYAWLEEHDHRKDTILVLTSDHGDYLGDHWLGEKDLFHAQSVKVPLILYDPSPEANSTRGSICDALVESIDLAATFADYAGAEPCPHILEGHSLCPIIQGKTQRTPREFVVSEYDYSQHGVAKSLDVAPKDARLFMLADQRWKLVHAEGGMRPMLFDLQEDPNEFCDLGADPAYRQTIAGMQGHLSQWARRLSQRTTISDTQITEKQNKQSQTGVLIGVYEESEVSPEAAAFYQSPVEQKYR